MRVPILIAVILVTMGWAAGHARAQMYRWVDERGVTNYANEPPADTRATKKLRQVENSMSVYTPDAAFMDAVKTMQEQRKQALLQPEPQRQQVHVIGARPQSPYEQCVASGSLGCNDLNNTYYPAYLPGVAVRPGRPALGTRFLTPAPAPAKPSGTVVARAPASRMPQR